LGTVNSDNVFLPSRDCAAWTVDFISPERATAPQPAAVCAFIWLFAGLLLVPEEGILALLVASVTQLASERQHFKRLGV
jgi:hypothetical protein